MTIFNFIIKGYLCGQCRGDKGVSALLNNCVTCGYFNILLIIALGEYIDTVPLISTIVTACELYPSNRS